MNNCFFPPWNSILLSIEFPRWNFIRQEPRHSISFLSLFHCIKSRDQFAHHFFSRRFFISHSSRPFPQCLLSFVAMIFEAFYRRTQKASVFNTRSRSDDCELSRKEGRAVKPNSLVNQTATTSSSFTVIGIIFVWRADEQLQSAQLELIREIEYLLLHTCK